MKLISCYIENFGCLQQYSLEFQPGITAIEEPNGFGKTTLAEFIRAMFYGLPRKNKNLQKDIRTKYMPWQGGKYGGNLIFEHQGTTYKIERSFGSVPRQDTFQLYNQDTHRKSTDFTENIGTELFELDADSFERSTYMPQMRDIESLTTDSIQAKLGNLVEDTNDINNYEKAIAALKAQRSLLIPYRGDGGTVAKSQLQISQLQNALCASRPVPEQLDQALLTLSQEKDSLKSKTEELEQVRRDITAASEAAARESLCREYQTLLSRETETKERCTQLLGKYPQGLPSAEELNRAEALLQENINLSTQQLDTQASQEAEEFLHQNSQRFSNGLPSFSEFQKHLAESRTYIAQESALLHEELSQQELQQYELLSRFFAPGLPDAEKLDTLEQQAQNLQQLKSQEELLKFPDQDFVKLQNLKEFFISGVPDQNQLRICQQKLSMAASLRRQNLELTAIVPRLPPESEKKKSLPGTLLLIFGVLLLLSGLVCLLSQMYMPGTVCSVLGLAGCIAALYLKLRQALSLNSQHYGGPSSSVQQDQIRRNEQMASSLEGEVQKLTENYLPGPENLAEKLLEIQTKAENFSALQQSYEESCQRLSSLTEQIQILEASLTQELSAYFESIPSYSRCISILKEKASLFRSLTENKRNSENRVEAIQKELHELKNSLQEFLCTYSLPTEPEHFTDSLYTLQRDCTTYLNAQKLCQQQQTKRQHHRDALKHNESQLSAFREKYGLELHPGDPQQLHGLREDITSLRDLNAQYIKDHSAVILFYEAHQLTLDSPTPENIGDAESLKQREQSLADEISQLSGNITDLDRQVRELRQITEEIPVQQDELEQCQLKMAEDQEKARLLDKTMEFMQSAKDVLSNQYLGSIRRNFTKYMAQLSQEDTDHLSVNPDLDVRLERLGEAREMAYFSAGQTDLVILCMRLALVDTLFENNQPLLILDDPFINLDDEHTEKALKLLKQLEQDHQILYLFCNSSRKIS